MRIVKPKRLPPPPPPPPRDPYYSSSVFPRQAASEYEAESVISGTPSTRSLQPINYTMNFGPLSSCASSVSQFASCCSCSNESQPTPKQRVSRPRLSISPEPRLATEDPILRKRKRPYDRYQSLRYRRYLERQIERIFKYLQDRKERIKKKEDEMKLMKVSEEDRRQIRKTIVASRESNHLRSLRARITPEDFEEIAMIGKGGWGRVSLVKKISHQSLDHRPEFYAMKRIKKAKVVEKLARVMAERDILAEANNEWIVQMHSSFQDEDYLYFILEYVPGGDLIDLLSQIGYFSVEWARFYIAEISLAVQAVHDMGFIHRDIKPDNILIDARGHVKLTDFGLSTSFRWSHDSSYYQDDSDSSHFGNCDGLNGNNLVDDHPTITKALTKRQEVHALKKRTLSLGIGSLHYTAPEVLAPDYRSYENFREHLCDWWSVGVILYEMIEGHVPFMDLVKFRNKIPDSPNEVQYRIVHWHRFLEFTVNSRDEGHVEARNLIMSFLCHPKDRLCQTGIGEIKNHPFFRSFDSDMWLDIRSRRAPFVPKLMSEDDTSNFTSSLTSNDKTLTDTLTCNIPGAKQPVHDFTFKSFPSFDRICRY